MNGFNKEQKIGRKKVKQFKRKVNKIKVRDGSKKKKTHSLTT